MTRRAKRSDRRTRRRSRRTLVSPRPASATTSADRAPTLEPLLLKQSQVLAALQVSRTAFWKLRNRPTSDPQRFPDPIRLSTFSLRWKLSDVKGWIERQAHTGAAA